MTLRIRSVLVLVLAGLLSFVASDARAAGKTCLTGTAPEVAGDPAQITALRQTIDATCDCASFDGSAGKKHGNYVRCANNAILTAVGANQLRPQCKSTVKQFYLDSTCGQNPKLHEVVCIKKTLANGKLGCSIKPTTRGDGVTPSDTCAPSPGKLDQVPCPGFVRCIDAADNNGDLRIAAPGDTGACNPILTPARLLLNEVSPNVANTHDRIELLAVTAGNTGGITVEQDIASPTVLATLPSIEVAAGDLIVVHLNPGPSDATTSETTSKDELPSSTFAWNFDAAWDVLGGTTGITYSDRVLVVRGADGHIQDAVPFIRSGIGAPPAGFVADLQAIQAAGLWLPASCGGKPCSNTTTPSATAVSVDWAGVGSTVTGKTAARTSATDTDTAADWAVGVSTLGVPNF